MSKHTPGPWQSHDDEYCPEDIYGDLDGPLEDGQVHGELVCEVNMEHPRWPANMRLIKAAPDLLAACELALTNIEFNGGRGSSSANTLRAAIRKANEAVAGQDAR